MTKNVTSNNDKKLETLVEATNASTNVSRSKFAVIPYVLGASGGADL